MLFFSLVFCWIIVVFDFFPEEKIWIRKDELSLLIKNNPYTLDGL
jgi:hypothetical protein